MDFLGGEIEREENGREHGIGAVDWSGEIW
jgi:hypothetical protein